MAQSGKGIGLFLALVGLILLVADSVIADVVRH